MCLTSGVHRVDHPRRSSAEVIRVAGLLGFTETDLTGENTIKISARYCIDLNAIRELRF